MKTTLKRALAFLFAFVMVVSLVPASMLAEDNGEAPVVDETVEVPAEVAPSTDIPEASPDMEYTWGGYTEAPAEEAPAEEAPVEEPTEEVPAEEAPAEEKAPVEESAEEDAPAEEPAEYEAGTEVKISTAQGEKATNNKPANITASNVRQMKISAWAKGTSTISTTGEDWSKYSKVGNNVDYTIGSVEGNDVDGYTTTVTFHFKSGDAFESAARTEFNGNTYRRWHPAWQGNWSYSFNASRPADQTLTLYWVSTINPLNGTVTSKWCILNAAGTGYANDITNAVAALIKVNLGLSRTVTYTDGVEDAELFADQSYTVSNGAATPAFEGTPQREGYRFDGWTPALAEKVYADAVYTAKWVKTYTVTYSDGKGGTFFADEVHVVDEGAATPAFEGSTEYAGWIFNGWTPTVAAKVNADATYVAQWKQGPVNTLRLDGNGGLKHGAPISDTYGAILGSDGSEFSYPGHVFAGWNTEQDGTGITYVKGDSIPFQAAHNGEVVVLYAQWVAGYKVLYVDGVDGKAFADQEYIVREGDAVPAFEGTPSRKGYRFLGWDVEAPETVTEDITFTAKWKVINDSDVPKTGDSDRILRPAVLMGALLLLGAGVAMTVVTKRRKQEN